MFKIYPSIREIKRQVDRVIARTAPYANQLDTEVSQGGNGRYKVYLTEKTPVVQSVGGGMLKTSTESWIILSLKELPSTIHNTIRMCRLPGLGTNPYAWLIQEAEDAHAKQEKEMKEERRLEARDFVKHLENPFIQVK